MIGKKARRQHLQHLQVHVGFEQVPKENVQLAQTKGRHAAAHHRAKFNQSQ